MKDLTHTIQATIPVIAIIGAVLLGYVKPDSYNQAVVGVLSGAVSGYFGALIPRDTDGDGVPDEPEKP